MEFSHSLRKAKLQVAVFFISLPCSLSLFPTRNIPAAEADFSRQMLLMILLPSSLVLSEKVESLPENYIADTGINSLYD